MSVRINRARTLISRGASVAKNAFPRDASAPQIFIGSVISEGLATTIGRRHEIELTIDEAVKLHADLGRYIEDMQFRLKNRS